MTAKTQTLQWNDFGGFLKNEFFKLILKACLLPSISSLLRRELASTRSNMDPLALQCLITFQREGSPLLEKSNTAPI